MSQITSGVLDRIDEFEPDSIVVLDAPESWDRSATLAKLATDNRLCEFLFLTTQRQTHRLESASLELWGVFLDGWNGEAHPSSGPVAGLLKSIHREFPKPRMATICTRGLGLDDVLRSLGAERNEMNQEQELVYDHNIRLVRRLRPAPTMQAPAPQVQLTKESVVVATGGAKGVTAVMLEALLRDSGCTVIAIGRSPLEAGPADFNGAEVEQEYYARLLREQPQTTAREMKSSFQAARARWGGAPHDPRTRITWRASRVHRG